MRGQLPERKPQQVPMFYQVVELLYLVKSMAQPLFDTLRRHTHMRTRARKKHSQTVTMTRFRIARLT